MTAEQLLQHMRGGSLLHMHFEDGEQVWWLSCPNQRVPKPVARAAIRDGALTADDDSLFEGEAPQTWAYIPKR